MKFIGLIYLDSIVWKDLNIVGQQDLLGSWHAFEQDLIGSGYAFPGAAFPQATSIMTVRNIQGSAVVSTALELTQSDQLSGVIFLNARDLNHAISLVSTHPSIRLGAIELRSLHGELRDS